MSDINDIDVLLDELGNDRKPAPTTLFYQNASTKNVAYVKKKIAFSTKTLWIIGALIAFIFIANAIIVNQQTTTKSQTENSTLIPIIAPIDEKK